MAMNRQAFSEKVGNVIEARDVMDRELVLTDPILDPIEAHVDRFRMFWGNCTVGYSNRTFIITCNRGGGLGVPDIIEDGALGAQEFGTGKNAGVLGLSGRGTNDGNGSGVHRDGGIIKIRHPGDAEVVEGAGDGAGLRSTRWVPGSRYVGSNPTNLSQ